MKINTDPEKIEKVLNRGVEDVFVKESLKKKLLSGRQLRVKIGIDPTGPKIHLGRAAALRKLRQFQDLGHQVILIVGDFTAMIGDPSDKLEKRPMLSEKEIKANMKNYKIQLGKIIDLKKTEFEYNSRWLKKLNAMEITNLAESFSVSQMSNRRNFKDRLEKREEVSLREFLYPLFQGYDSVIIQLFNLKAGRIVQKHYKMPQQDILTVEMLEGTDGRKMSTSWGNVITIADEPSDMFGKIMSVRDDLVPKYFRLCTDISESEILKDKNPRDLKIKLAYEIVKIYHGEKAAQEAQKSFTKIFQKKEIPEDLPEIIAHKGEFLSDVLVRGKIVKSKNDFGRLIKEGAIINLSIMEKLQTTSYKLQTNLTLRIGKKRFVKIVV
ncbi:MAG: Tyrosine-tRNA ligase [Parcubacteria group bacterium GW2011_GWF2_44_7]|nr:MAG: Tyrosine-tRNA ligase [Parcubacteria group bacterium GW2011_GWF2_44_7]